MKVNNLLKFIFDQAPFLLDRNQGVFVECGANDGQYVNVCHELSKIGWIGINIECNPYCFKKLLRNRPNEINIPFALSEQDFRQVEFYIPRKDPSGRDKLTGNASIIKLSEWGNRQLETIKVWTITFDMLCELYHIEEVDLFVLDVEGYEHVALKGINKILPHVFCIEWFRDKANIEKWLKDKGYVIKGEFKGNVVASRTN